MSDLVKLAEVRAAARAGTCRRVRLAAHLSLREVAAAVGVGVSTIYRWEVGERRPQGRPALRYAKLIAELEVATNGGGRDVPPEKREPAFAGSEALADNEHDPG
jgi:transcriptional regulator with XRE-family HTH domain